MNCVIPTLQGVRRARRVNSNLVMFWDGHSQDSDVKTSSVDRGYADYSQYYILTEAKKVNYLLEKVA